MKPQQTIKGYLLTANTPVDIMATFGSPVVMIQNQAIVQVNLTLNDGVDFILDVSPFAWEPYTPLVGTIETDGTNVVVFA